MKHVLSSGRHQAAVFELDGFMYAAGGAESWNCLNSVERYNPENNTWTLVAPMNVARRGAGIAVHAGEPVAVHERQFVQIDFGYCSNCQIIPIILLSALLL